MTNADLDARLLRIAPERRQRILGLSLPIIGGMASQNVLNLIDTAMVGSLGDQSLAGVGIASFFNFLVSAFILGQSAGVQAMASRRLGEGEIERTAVPLNGGLLIAIGMAIPWSALLFSGAWGIFPFLTDDPAVVGEAVPYFRARMCAMAAMGMNFAFRGYWNAVDRSKLYMTTLVLMHVSNVLLNWVLIFGNLGAPAFGALGAGMASAISTWIGTIAYFVLGLRNARREGFLRGLPDEETVLTMFRLSVPAGMQQFFFAAGMTAFMVIVGEIGTSELAATKVLIDLLLVGVLPGVGFGLGAATLVGQALGRGEPDDARRWGWEVVRIAALLVALLALPAMLAPRAIVGVFLRQPHTLELAVIPLRMLAFFIAFDSVGTVLMNAMMGAGDTRRVMLVSTGLQWLLFLPATYVVGPLSGWGLTAVFAVWIAYRAIQAMAFGALWSAGHWRGVRV